MAFVLRAPDADKRRLEDYRHHWQEFSYTETIDVIDGIARCNNETTKHMLVGLGYILVDPSLICACAFVALNAAELLEHAEKCPEAREVEVESTPRTARKEGKARRAREAHEVRLARKEEKAHRARVKHKVRKPYELIKTRLVCRDCGRVCMSEEEFIGHKKTCPERKSRL